MKPVLHTYPTRDLVEHLLDGPFCICMPKVTEYEFCIYVVHNSFDGREILEGALAMLNNPVIDN